MKNIFIALILFIAVCNFSSCTKGGKLQSVDGDVYTVSGTADSKQLVPSSLGVGISSFLGSYDGTLNVLNFTLNWTALWTTSTPDAILNIKFYGPAAVGSNGTLRHTISYENSTSLTGSTSFSLSGYNAIRESEKNDLISGKWYYVVCTRLFPDGIIRGQLNVVKTDPNAVPVNLVTSVTLSAANNYVLKTGDKSILKFGIEPTYASNKTLIWTSSDPLVATVDNTGTVTAVGSGFATITATAADGSNVKASAEVAVNFKQQESELARTGWTVTCSSEKVSDGGGAVAILDGNLGTYWHSMWGPDVPLPHWLLVDMKQVYKVSKVVVQRRTGNTDTKTVIVQTSMDNATFDNAGTITCTADANPISFSARNARYIKLTITESNRSPYANVAELYVSETKWIPL